MLLGAAGSRGCGAVDQCARRPLVKAQIYSFLVLLWTDYVHYFRETYNRKAGSSCHTADVASPASGNAGNTTMFAGCGRSIEFSPPDSLQRVPDGRHVGVASVHEADRCSSAIARGAQSVMPCILPAASIWML